MFSASGSARRLVTQILTSGTWVAPSTTTQIEVASGYGAPGSPGGTRASGTYVDTVTGVLSGSGAHAGSFSWADFQGDAQSIVNAINGGSTVGGVNGARCTIYVNSNTYDLSLDSAVYADAIPGTAYASYSSGWKTSGFILAGDYGQSFINYQQEVAATTGAAATAFGQSFPGGSGGTASTTTINAIPVTPGASYTITVPSGGALTISYYQ